MNNIRKLLGYTIKLILVSIVLLFMVVVVIVILEIKVNLNYLNKPIELAVEQLTDRDFSMRGNVVLIPTLWPTLEITDVSMSNPPGEQWQSGKTFVHFGRLYLQLGLIPLLSGEIHVAEITAEDIKLNLETDRRGYSNWEFNRPTSAKPGKTDTTVINESSQRQTVFHFETLDNIRFNNIQVHFVDQSIHSTMDFKLQNLSGHISSVKGIELEFKGRLQDKHYSGKLSGSALNDLRSHQKKWPLTVNMNIAGTRVDFSGTWLRGSKPELSATLEIGTTDVGATLAWLNIVDGLLITGEHLTVKTVIKGNSLAEIIADAQLDVLLKNATWILKDKNTAASLPVRISRGKINLRPDQPVKISLDGMLDDSKITIDIVGAKAIDYTAKNARTPVKINIRSLHSHLQLETLLSRNISTRNLDFKMLFEGRKFSDLNPLFNTELPPFGPYRVSGFFAVNDAGYRIKDLKLVINNSHLKGDLLLNTQKRPVFLQLVLNSRQIQLNDFKTGNWSAVEPGEPDTNSAEQKAEQTEHSRKKVQKLLSYDNLKRYEADIILTVDKVLSGKDILGMGKLSVQLKQARLSLDLEQLELPGGSANATFIYKPSGQRTLDIALKTHIERFNYGILARRIDPASKVAGLISLDVDLVSAKVSNIHSLLTNSEGHIDFAWMPEALNADLFELWAVNLITAVLKSADKSSASKVNCVIGRFVLDKGMLHQKVIYADTTRMRMVGEAEADFNKRTVKVRVTPRAKKPEFFSLATPVSVQGSFDKFSLSINPLGLTKTVVSFVTSPIHVPVRRLFEKGLPQDGKEACKAMWAVSETEQ